MSTIERAQPAKVNLISALGGGSPGDSFGTRAKHAAYRAVRTLIQGVVASFGTGVAGVAVLTASYWEVLGVSLIGAVITAVVSFAQNVAAILPADPNQNPPP